ATPTAMTNATSALNGLTGATVPCAGSSASDDCGGHPGG
ncbi:MAG: hypothetical protein QOD35_2542, partial [Nocardioidaceae bacterium]|nr:hypothetical protein [Nocardioidaceae bacterium]